MDSLIEIQARTTDLCKTDKEEVQILLKKKKVIDDMGSTGIAVATKENKNSFQIKTSSCNCEGLYKSAETLFFFNLF